MTRHACERCRTRKISTSAVDVTMVYGNRRVRRGAEIYILGWREVGYASNFAIPHAPLFGGGVVVHARRRRGCGSGVIVATRCSNRSSWLAPKNRSAAVVPSSRRRT